MHNHITFEIEDDDEIVLSKIYSLNSIIINRCNCTLTLHSVWVVIKDDKVYYCDDDQIFEGLPKSCSMKTIKSKCYL